MTKDAYASTKKCTWKMEICTRRARDESGNFDGEMLVSLMHILPQISSSFKNTNEKKNCCENFICLSQGPNSLIGINKYIKKWKIIFYFIFIKNLIYTPLLVLFCLILSCEPLNRSLDYLKTEI